jgi:hypothetical protein
MAHAQEPLDAPARNRTGLLSSEDRELMLHSVDGFVPVGEKGDLAQQRILARADQPLIGSMVPAGSWTGQMLQGLKKLQGESLAALIDKVGERLAFERTGTRLYDVILEKFGQFGGFDGGPDARGLQRIRDEEAAHFGMLTEAMKTLGGDPTAITPSANLAALASSGVLAAIADARTSVAQCLEAVLIAELVDDDAWRRLITLAQGLGQEDLARLFEQASQDEERHLVQVRSWVEAHSRLMSGS